MPALLPPPGDPETLYVMDLSGFVFRAYHALPPLSNSRGEPTHAVHGVTAMIHKLVTERRPAYFAMAIDARGSSFRKEIYEGYKATRKEKPADLEPQADRVREIAEAFGIPCLEAEGMEADDIIATLVAQARAAGLKVVIASADKDLLQLVGEGVVMLDSMRDRVYGPQECLERLKVPPHQVRDLLALMGDSSDNVPGVRSVGPKTAVQLLTEHGTLDGVYAAIESITRKSLKAKLIEHKDDAYLSQRLVSLRTDVPIAWDKDALRYGGWNVARLRELFAELELHKPSVELEKALARQGDPAATGPRVERPAPPPPRPKVAFAAPKEARVELDVDALRGSLERAMAQGPVAMLTLLEGDDARRAPIAGVAFAWEGDAVYVPIGHVYLGRPKQPSQSGVAAAIAPLLGAHDASRVAHDLKREALVWGREGLEYVPSARDFDTMLACYLLDADRHGHELEAAAEAVLSEPLGSEDALRPKVRGHGRTPFSDLEVELVAPFAVQRAAALLVVAAEQRARMNDAGLSKVMDDVEMPLMSVLVALESRGVLIDSAMLAALSTDAETRIRALETRCHALAGKEFNVASPRALESILFDELGLPVIKRTKTARSTDHEVLEELAPHHPLPDAILELRQLEKLRGTYLDALPRQVDPDTGRVHTRFNQAVAATGRLSSSEPNLQNIPIRTDFGRQIRAAFIAPEGMSILSADYSQIELRVLAHASGDPELLDAFQNHADVHVRTAKALFDVLDEGVTREMRAQAKTVNFAVIYGQSEFALARNLRIEQREARRYIDAFFARYVGVARYLAELVDEARETGGVRTLLGRFRAVPDIESRNRTVRWGAERIAKNTPIQGTAADIMKLAMIAIRREVLARGLESRMILTVHDELVFEVPDAEREEMRALVRAQMEGAYPLHVPLVVDDGLGPSWGAAH